MSVTYRPGKVEDSRAVFDIFERAITDLGRRHGMMAISGGDDLAVIESLWKRRKGLFDHLARTAAHFWVAEREGAVVGYARSILRDGLYELTDFFVDPGEQSGGVGRELFQRAFPDEPRAYRRSIIATTDVRALSRYLKAGVYGRFPLIYFSREPEGVPVDTDLDVEPLADSPQSLAALREVDRVVLGHTRDADHRWLMEDRRGVLYLRRGEPVGYGYLGPSHGPFALLDPGDYRAVLAHAEREAHRREHAFGAEVPLVNRAAVDALLARGCRLDTFVAVFMSDAPFGSFERYIFTSPPFFL